MQLCTTQEFRQKIAGGDPSLPKLIEKNDKPHGIPQGAPISDILANIYLIDFDGLMDSYAKALGGVYFRYSDDILIIIPGDASVGLRARDHAMAEITKFGSEIKIKPQKTSVIVFTPDAAGHLGFNLIAGEQGRNGLEYLGFRLMASGSTSATARYQGFTARSPMRFGTKYARLWLAIQERTSIF